MLDSFVAGDTGIVPKVWNQMVEHYADRIHEDEAALERIQKHFFGVSLSDLPEPSLDDLNNAYIRFMFWYFFRYRTHSGAQTLLEDYIEHHSMQLGAHELLILTGFLQSVFGIFEVESLQVGRSLDIRLLSGGMESYHMIERAGSRELSRGDLVIGWITPWSDTSHVFLGKPVFLPAASAYSIRRIFHAPGQTQEQKAVTPEDVEHLFFFSPKIHAQDGNIRKRLRRFIHKHFGDKSLTVAAMEKKIREAIDSSALDASVLDELLGLTHRRRLDAGIEQQFLDLIHEFWNTLVEEVKPASDDQKPGTIESILMADFIRMVQQEITVKSHPQEKQAQQAMDSLMQKWLHEPQLELHGETPWQVIEAERKRTGSKREGFPLDLQIQRFGEPDCDLTVIDSKPLIVQDMEIFFRNIESHGGLRITKELRNISWPRVVELEALFVRKDRMAEFFRNDRRGEELHMRYVYFVDLLAMAARLVKIRHDVLTLTTAGREWLALTTGEKWMRLCRHWLYELDWKCCFVPYYAPVADMYQDKPESVLGNLDLLGDNKIALRDFFWQFFGSKRQMLELDANQEILKRTEGGFYRVFCERLEWMGLIEIDRKKTSGSEGRRFPWVEDDYKDSYISVSEDAQKVLNALIDDYVRTRKK
ncbi:hypothetical protein AUK40_02145 [Candidatus Wirthbacteria bacterium CG2_30_54_11]|uniref:Uncharacterized protein n=1 Tax=Candidatus Wirthbacteria bacterium CG2_30_54_11 TaxID=1817892 RepID=A0A1J5J0F0_9BACT|nr:MAG: hypothetical protein AUK40_02145 [Candidatus Wirthbacteria bacterium CG2_30_54_11]